MRYEIRAAVSDPASNTVASVFSEVSIPKFASAPLSVSGVMVDVAASATATPAATTRRAFRRGERVRALMQIYQGTGRTEANRAGVDARADSRRQGRRGARSVAAVRRDGVHEPSRRLRDYTAALEPAARGLLAQAGSVSRPSIGWAGATLRGGIARESVLISPEGGSHEIQLDSSFRIQAEITSTDRSRYGSKSCQTRWSTA